MPGEPDPIRATSTGVSIAVRAKPRSAKDAIGGLRAGALDVSIRAIPEAGRANTAIEALLATQLGVPARDVRVVRGGSSRLKHVEIDGVTAARVRNALGMLDLSEDPREQLARPPHEDRAN